MNKNLLKYFIFEFISDKNSFNEIKDYLENMEAKEITFFKKDINFDIFKVLNESEINKISKIVIEFTKFLEYKNFSININFITDDFDIILDSNDIEKFYGMNLNRSYSFVNFEDKTLCQMLSVEKYICRLSDVLNIFSKNTIEWILKNNLEVCLIKEDGCSSIEKISYLNLNSKIYVSRDPTFYY